MVQEDAGLDDDGFTLFQIPTKTMSKVKCFNCKWYLLKANHCTKLNAVTYEYRERECNLHEPKEYA